MVHSYTAPATRDVIEYLRNGGREFYTWRDLSRGGLFVNFLATPEYVAKMLERPFIENKQIYRQV